MPSYNKYNREKFYNVADINGTKSLDLSSNRIDNFVFTRDKQYYTIVEQDLKRPDVISFKHFGTTEYYWIILKMNNIVDPFNDLEIGDVIQIPNKLDIEEFVTNSKAR